MCLAAVGGRDRLGELGLRHLRPQEGPLKKIFMLEPLRGTEAHVRQL